MKDKASVKIDIDNIGIFRPAEAHDIKEGNLVFLVGNGSVLHKFTIDEVRNPEDDFKAFVADDGCRYGLMDLYVLISDSELHQQLKMLTEKLNSIKELL